MPVVLRFGNREDIDTIAKHEEILDPHGVVWWGWFKKSHERFPGCELRKLAEQPSIQVGLVNRDERDYYAARCDRIVITHGEDTAIRCPDIAHTPKYYYTQMLFSQRGSGSQAWSG